MIIALIALMSGSLLSAGLAANGTMQVPIGFAILTTVNLLLAIISRSRKMVAVHRLAARGSGDKQARMLEQNADLRLQIDQNQRLLLEIHDGVLRRVGIELHDGPAQLIGLALLRLEGLLPQESSPEGRPYSDYELIRAALHDALAEIRSMSAGLTLPDLNAFAPDEVLRLAVRNHERWTATAVTCVVEGLPEHLPAPVKSCLYRFTQEALNNAYRHGGGRGQSVRARYSDDTIELEVADGGPGFEPSDIIADGHLGLFGMSHRIASVGGTLDIASDRRAGGTRLT
ncbi:MAG TPA: ATP-binding protein, partial [Hyphomicrobiaceae bacterium]|nr:ATP-binding protein [Hyphomicrobiaceae bacterium]